MKIHGTVITSLAGLVAAAPAMLGEAHNVRMSELAKRQGGGVCFVFARGSTEPAPLGMLIGPPLQTALRSHFPGLKTIPVQYAARLDTNMSPQRTDAASIAKGNEAFKQAAGCSQIVAGGYSQGAAVMHNVVSKLDPSIKNKIVGVALFGDTRNKQDGGHIPNLPATKSKVWCNPSDGVCGGGLNVNAGHLSYSNTQIREAGNWLAANAKSGGNKGGATTSKQAPKVKDGSKTPKGPAVKENFVVEESSEAIEGSEGIEDAEVLENTEVMPPTWRF